MLAVRRNVVLLTATAASAFVVMPRSGVCRLNDRFFSTDKDEELRRLRQENEQLKSRLDEEKGGLFSGLRKMFGGEKKTMTPYQRQKKELDQQIDQVLGGTGLLGGFMGSMMKGIAGMAAKSFAQTSEDIERVQQAAVDALTTQLGASIQFDSPMQQAYSSSSINGVVTKNIQLVFQASGSQASGYVQVSAQIDSYGNVDIINLSFNDQDFRGGGPGDVYGDRRYGLKSGNVIDV